MTKSKAKKPKPKSPPKSLVGRLKDEAHKLIVQVEGLFSAAPQDIVAAIEDDHKSLRNFLGILKDTDKNMAERRAAYKSFSALLKSHSASEEKVAYETARELSGREMHIKSPKVTSSTRWPKI